MKLEKKIFVFKPLEDGRKIDLNNSFIVVNGDITTIPISFIFSKISIIKDTSIKGFSIMEFMTGGRFLFGKDGVEHDLLISFVDKNGNIFSMEKMYDPQIIMDSLTVDENDVKEIINSLLDYKRVADKEKVDVVYLNNDFLKEVDEAVENGYSLIYTEPKSNIYALVKGDKTFIIEVMESDYSVLDDSLCSFSINENNNLLITF